LDSGPLAGVVAVLLVLVAVVVVLAVTEAWVAPADGASWTPGALELPQAARPAPRAQTDMMVSNRFLIGGAG
jgi:hypothetical protein